MRYSYPLDSIEEFVERLDVAPAGVPVRRWVVRDDNQQHYHGVVRLDEDPACVELHWKADARGREQLVGLYRLHLRRLLQDGFIRQERDDDAHRNELRLRFYRGEKGVVFVQARDDGPALPIGIVDRTIG